MNKCWAAIRDLKNLHLLAFLAGLSAPSYEVSAEAAALHVASSCMPINNLFAVSFSTKNKESVRRIVFDFDYDDVRVGASNIKGTVKWSEVSMIIYKAQTESSGFLTIEFTAPILLGTSERHKEIEFGVIALDCWNSMVSNLAAKTGVAFEVR